MATRQTSPVRNPALKTRPSAVALAVACEAVRAGVAQIRDGVDLEAEVDAAMWWPAYAPYVPA